MPKNIILNNHSHNKIIEYKYFFRENNNYNIKYMYIYVYSNKKYYIKFIYEFNIIKKIVKKKYI